jgi:hypothetical protein
MGPIVEEWGWSGSAQMGPIYSGVTPPLGLKPANGAALYLKKKTGSNNERNVRSFAVAMVE